MRRSEVPHLPKIQGNPLSPHAGFCCRGTAGAPKMWTRRVLTPQDEMGTMDPTVGSCCSFVISLKFCKVKVKKKPNNLTIRDTFEKPEEEPAIGLGGNLCRRPGTGQQPSFPLSATSPSAGWYQPGGWFPSWFPTGWYQRGGNASRGGGASSALAAASPVAGSRASPGVAQAMQDWGSPWPRGGMSGISPPPRLRREVLSPSTHQPPAMRA